jgi:hypothetical protein
MLKIQITVKFSFEYVTSIVLKTQKIWIICWCQSNILHVQHIFTHFSLNFLRREIRPMISPYLWVYVLHFNFQTRWLIYRKFAINVVPPETNPTTHILSFPWSVITTWQTYILWDVLTKMRIPCSELMYKNMSLEICYFGEGNYFFKIATWQLCKSCFRFWSHGDT